MKILTTIANYNGNSNPYIERVKNKLKTISDVVIFSPDEMDIEGVKTEIRSKDLGQGFTFAPRQYILDHIDDYDYVLYNEDDVLIPQESLEYAIQINEKLIRHNLQYTVGFLRYELENNIEEFVDLHPGHSIHFSGNGVSDIIRFITNINNEYYFNAWNPHSGNFLLSRDQIKLLKFNNKFPTQPENTYSGIIETAASGFNDVMQKFTPVTEYKKLMVHHMSNKYVFNPVKVSTDMLDNLFNFIPDDLQKSYLNLS